MRYTLLAFAALALAACSDGNRCRVHWRLGEIDPRFDINKLDVMNAATAAADVWNNAAGRQILLYDGKRGIPLNLVYDVHHAEVAADRAQRDEIRQLEKTIDILKPQFDANPSEGLADRINQLVARHNRLVEAYNAQPRREFKQGSYQTSLEVYAFADLNDLELVMTHEFGHALGLGHLADSTAVMNARHAIGTATQVELSTADRQALDALCR